MRPCATTLSSTVSVTAAITTSAVEPSRESNASTPNTTEARPRGPNQPMNATVTGVNPQPISTSATGTMRTTVRARTAKTTVCHVTFSSAGSIAAPNRNQTTSDRNAPLWASNSSVGSRSPPERPVPNAIPPTNAPMNPLPPSSIASA